VDATHRPKIIFSRKSDRVHSVLAPLKAKERNSATIDLKDKDVVDPSTGKDDMVNIRKHL